ncbi:hypothetical protein VTL71DRAFT_6323 [Oculimacula yallundae]|uniref:2EXR domain-containing protein n=1 Tax=Oculimacula yallundae TaxID=86028 RepID=A0ABR4BXI4_9HELO
MAHGDFEITPSPGKSSSSQAKQICAVTQHEATAPLENINKLPNSSNSKTSTELIVVPRHDATGSRFTSLLTKLTPLEIYNSSRTIPLLTFAPFSKLPLELRNMIWKFAASEPRVVKFFRNRIPSSMDLIPERPVSSSRSYARL